MTGAVGTVTPRRYLCERAPREPFQVALRGLRGCALTRRTRSVGLLCPAHPEGGSSASPRSCTCPCRCLRAACRRSQYPTQLLVRQVAPSTSRPDACSVYIGTYLASSERCKAFWVGSDRRSPGRGSPCHSECHGTSTAVPPGGIGRQLGPNEQICFVAHFRGDRDRPLRAAPRRQSPLNAQAFSVDRSSWSLQTKIALASLGNVQQIPAAHPRTT